MGFAYADFNDLESVKADMEYRDKNDSGRDFAPLKAAEDSVIVDSTDMSIEQTIDKICSIAEERQRNKV